jgi:ABC-type transporter Mla subunit MlaD
MNRQALVGLFTILGLGALFVMFLVLADVGSTGRYDIGVRFKSAAGLHKGALVYESGVNVGIVDATRLLPSDFTVDVILAINNNVDIPRDAEFLIEAPLTGDSTIEIVPKAARPQTGSLSAPASTPGATAILPHEILPLEQQPVGTNPVTVAQLLAQGQGEIARFDSLLADLQHREPALLNSFQAALTNANELAVTSNQTVQHLSQRIDAITGPLQIAITAGSANILDITRQLDASLKTDRPKVDTLVTTLNAAAQSLNATAESVRKIAADPKIHANMEEATRGLAETTTSFAAVLSDVHKVTGDAQTQTQLRDAVSNADAVFQKTNSLLRSLGGKSSVPGVDPGAIPAPRPSGSGSTLPLPNASPSSPPQDDTLEAGSLSRKLTDFAHHLIALQLRVGELDRAVPGSNSSPLLNQDRGPQTDLNAIILPSEATSVFAGANDIGSGTPTYNIAALRSLGTSGVRVGGGVVYSRLGFLGSFTKGVTSLEARYYDPRHPSLDGYLHYALGHHVGVFGGERDVTHTGRRTDFGLQLQF